MHAPGARAPVSLPTGQLPTASAQFLPASFEVMIGWSLPDLSVQEVAERRGLAFRLVASVAARLTASPVPPPTRPKRSASGPVKP
ncbi:MAG: hypothetical protein WCD21_08940 [Streptomyces sp.]